MDLIGVHHVTLTVTDLDRTVAWYESVLGFRNLSRYRNDAIAAECVVLGHPTASPPTIGLRRYDATGEMVFDEHRVGLDHIAFNVGAPSALRSWEVHLDELGVDYEVTALPELSILVMRDPDNIQVELCTQIVDAPSSIDENDRIVLPGGEPRG